MEWILGGGFRLGRHPARAYLVCLFLWLPDHPAAWGVALGPFWGSPDAGRGGRRPRTAHPLHPAGGKHRADRHDRDTRSHGSFLRE